MRKGEKLSSLSIFIPCFNEAENLIPMFRSLDKIGSIVAEKHEIIIINDGSTDSTGKIAKKLSQKHPQLKLVEHHKNKGYGASLKSGFKHASYEWIFYTDADRQFNVNQLETFIHFTQDFDIIIGYRKKRADGMHRAINAWIFKLFIDALFRIKVKDIDCAFKLIRASRLKNLDLSTDGAMISAEMLYKLKKKGIIFKQLPVSHYKRKAGSSTGNNPAVIIKAGLEAVKLYISIKTKTS